jgi:uncharacterized membrane protein YhaH (DUF805 family)
MEFLRILFSPVGRIGRLAYWMASVFTWVVLLVFSGLTRLLPQGDGASAAVAANLGGYIVWLAFLFGLLILYFWWGFAISAKRWHDRGKSAVWVLINFIPLIGPLWQFVECGLLPGTPGPNSYGAVPGDLSPRQTAEVFT